MDAPLDTMRQFLSIQLSTLLFGFVLVLWNCSCAFGEFVHPKDVQIPTLVYSPEVLDIQLGRYDYDISWQGLPVAQSSIAVSYYDAPHNLFYYVQVLVHTSKLIRWAYKLQHLSESIFAHGNYKSVSFQSQQFERKKENVRKVDFDNTGIVRSENWKNGKLERALEFDGKGQVCDPISAAFLARSLPMNVGEKIQVDVFNASHRYLITFNIVAKEQIIIGNSYREAFRVVPEIRKLTDTKGLDKFKSAVLWISTDYRRDVLKLESSVWIGSVTAELKQFVADDGKLLALGKKFNFPNS